MRLTAARCGPHPDAKRLRGPSRLATLVALARLARDEAGTIGRLFDAFGDLVAMHVPAVGPVVFVGSHALAKAVVTGDSQQLDPNRIQRELMGPAYGLHSVFLLDGPAHHRLRRMPMPPLRGETLASYAAIMGEVVARSVARWPVGQTLALVPELHEISLEIILRVVLGIERAADLARWAEAFRGFLGIALSEEAALRFLARKLGGLSRWRAFHAARLACDRLLFAEVRARRSGGRPRDDLLQRLLEARDEQGEPMTDAEIRDQLMTLILAGHETTATTAAWSFERLVRHPHALRALTDEARAGTDSAYTRAAIHETLRVRPPLWGLARWTLEPIVLGGQLVPAGTLLVPYFPRIHRDPQAHPAPDAFRPERFLDVKPDATPWMPFGGGAHRCLGDHFALMEVRIILQTVMRAVDLEATDPRDEPTQRRAIAHVPGRGCSVRVTRRVDAPRATHRERERDANPYG